MVVQAKQKRLFPDYPVVSTYSKDKKKPEGKTKFLTHPAGKRKK
jgi:hypothetical protein